ncbi:hypothetical protein [Paraburkholderia sp. BR14320]|uniref:hypothetical protein n=1 Tax=unclassified Paraburkholderia TaxID=2615204 RepID=UPI0034CF328A
MKTLNTQQPVADIPVIRAEQLEHHDLYSYTAEASELGWRPGYVPEVLGTDMGNGQPFRLAHADAQRFMYRQLFGCISLTVFND